MLIDSSKCADGCDACVAACNQENGLDLQDKPESAEDSSWDRQVAKWIRTVKVRDNLTGQESRLPMMCLHCEHPPCVDVCPTGASFKRADGIVMVDRHTCIGCRYCMMACPYKARSFIHEVVDLKLTRAPRGKGCVESCNLCVHRRDNGGSSTACADACAAEGHNAIVFGDLKDPESPLSKALATLPSRQIREDLALNTGVRYAGV
jgi:molybdopterin-containing oxidoreductase family iron-sulfur binding subunit